MLLCRKYYTYLEGPVGTEYLKDVALVVWESLEISEIGCCHLKGGEICIERGEIVLRHCSHMDRVGVVMPHCCTEGGEIVD